MTGARRSSVAAEPARRRGGGLGRGGARWRSPSRARTAGGASLAELARRAGAAVRPCWPRPPPRELESASAREPLRRAAAARGRPLLRSRSGRARRARGSGRRCGGTCGARAIVHLPRRSGARRSTPGLGVRGRASSAPTSPMDASRRCSRSFAELRAGGLAARVAEARPLAGWPPAVARPGLERRVGARVARSSPSVAGAARRRRAAARRCR